MIDKLVGSINKDGDAALILNLDDETKINHFHLEFEGDMLGQEVLRKLIDKIKKLDLYYRVHIGLKAVVITDDKIALFSSIFDNVDPYEITLNMINIELSDGQFDYLFNSLCHMNNLQKLHLKMENLNLTKNKIESLHNVLKILKLKKLVHIFLNLEKNEIQVEHMNILKDILEQVN